MLNDLFVHESHRRKGIGSLLLAAAVEFGEASGAQALYQSAGWRRDEQLFVYHYAIPAQ